MGIVESKAASFTQLKGVEEIVTGIGGSKIETDDNSEGNSVGNRGSVCVDMVAVEDGGMIGECV